MGPLEAQLVGHRQPCPSRLALISFVLLLPWIALLVKAVSLLGIVECCRLYNCVVTSELHNIQIKG
jgi:hypothetical protein